MQKQTAVKKQKTITALSLAFIGALYLPFFIYVLTAYDAAGISLSYIGWRLSGFPLLLFYGPATIAFLLYQIHNTQKITGQKSKFLTIASEVSAIFLSLAVFTPFRETDPAFLLKAHTAFGFLGSLSFVAVISCLIYSKCKMTGASRLTKISYSVFLAVMIMLFVIFKTAALFEIGASLAFMLVICLFNSGITLRRTDGSADVKSGTAYFSHEKKSVAGI